MLSQSIRLNDINATTPYIPMNAVYMSLPDKLNDVAAKYETLEQHNKTLELENNAYKQHIAELEFQIEELQQDSSQFLEERNQSLRLQPMLHEHISSIQLEKEEYEQEIEKLKHIINAQSESIKTLKSENNIITQQNGKLQIALESNKKQIQILKQIHTESRNRNNNTTQTLHNENILLKQELNAYKSYHQNNMQSHSPTVLTPPCNENDMNTPVPMTIMMNTPISMNSIGQTPISMNSLPAIYTSMNNNGTISFSCDMPQFVPNRKRTNTAEHETETMGFLTNLNSGFSENGWLCSETKYNDKIEVLKQRIERLEFDNNELIKKLEKLQCEEDEKCNDKLDAFDWDESKEMELLFEKCNSEIINKGVCVYDMDDKDSEADDELSLIEKYRFLRWEFQIRAVVQ